MHSRNHFPELLFAAGTRQHGMSRVVVNFELIVCHPFRLQWVTGLQFSIEWKAGTGRSQLIQQAPQPGRALAFGQAKDLQAGNMLRTTMRFGKEKTVVDQGKLAHVPYQAFTGRPVSSMGRPAE